MFPVLLLLSGCAGVNASHSVSPLDFFMPGLLQANPPPSSPDGLTPVSLSGAQLAQAN
jgi:hypothetical protein